MKSHWATAPNHAAAEEVLEVEGLRYAFQKEHLKPWADAACSWCQERRLRSFAEVANLLVDLSTHLQLKPLEVNRLRKALSCQFSTVSAPMEEATPILTRCLQKEQARQARNASAEQAQQAWNQQCIALEFQMSTHTNWFPSQVGMWTWPQLVMPWPSCVSQFDCASQCLGQAPYQPQWADRGPVPQWPDQMPCLSEPVLASSSKSSSCWVAIWNVSPQLGGDQLCNELEQVDFSPDVCAKVESGSFLLCFRRYPFLAASFCVALNKTSEHVTSNKGPVCAAAYDEDRDKLPQRLRACCNLIVEEAAGNFVISEIEGAVLQLSEIEVRTLCESDPHWLFRKASVSLGESANSEIPQMPEPRQTDDGDARAKRGIAGNSPAMMKASMISEMKRINALNLEPAVPRLEDKAGSNGVNSQQQTRNANKATGGSGLKMEFQQSLELINSRDASKQQQQQAKLQQDAQANSSSEDRCRRNPREKRLPNKKAADMSDEELLDVGKLSFNDQFKMFEQFEDMAKSAGVLDSSDAFGGQSRDEYMKSRVHRRLHAQASSLSDAELLELGQRSFNEQFPFMEKMAPTGGDQQDGFGVEGGRDGYLLLKVHRKLHAQVANLSDQEVLDLGKLSFNQQFTSLGYPPS